MPVALLSPREIQVAGSFRRSYGFRSRWSFLVSFVAQSCAPVEEEKWAMAKRVFLATALVALIVLAGASTASASSIVWQTQPILGTSVLYDGNVVVVTAGGDWTIPHHGEVGYAEPTAASMTEFWVGPSGFATIATGSGAFVLPNTAYEITTWFAPRVGSVYGTPIEVVTMNPTPTSDPYWMLWGYKDNGSTIALPVGEWVYQERWAQLLDSETSTREFVVRDENAPVPEPATMTLLGLGLVGVARAARKRKK